MTLYWSHCGKENNVLIITQESLLFEMSEIVKLCMLYNFLFNSCILAMCTSIPKAALVLSN